MLKVYLLMVIMIIGFACINALPFFTANRPSEASQWQVTFNDDADNDSGKYVYSRMRG
ncbi:hypothetical protein ANCCEY_00020 [Ancylostoma ceylanicum]|uniref:Uncharacterized protein n=1 Tax=Ancylostoma ceylanicum TaxID=53326 RepID=A0A0D6MAS9_9BILA|nr:hypothetical protein ANCCEY_00020 [Ancylostoma ceylanicum]